MVLLSTNEQYSMRTTKTISISMPPADLKLAERLAKATNRSLSGVIREGIKRLAAEQYWKQVQSFAGPRADALGITEADVNRLVQEYRQEKRTKPVKKKTK